MNDPTSPDYWQHTSGCPRLFLAPMEGLGDHFFRRAIASIGGFDEACTAFLSVPSNAHVRSLARAYVANETAPAPQAAQIMGFHPDLMAAMAIELEKRGAPRIDLNCGCPSNTVTGRGAGSSLLREPEHLYTVAKAIYDAISIPFSIKLRSGYRDTALFDENMRAAEESGAAFITLHPRTKIEAYKPPAHWNLIARAKETLSIPVVGNGDIQSVADVVRMRNETGCDGIMIGRAAVSDPWIFHDIKTYYTETHSVRDWDSTEQYLHRFWNLLREHEAPVRTQVNKLKQMARYLVKDRTLLRLTQIEPMEFLQHLLNQLRQEWEDSDKLQA